MEEMDRIKILLDERSKNIELFYNTWGIINNWYVFFFTSNLLSLGWILSKDTIFFTEIVKNNYPLSILSGFWLILNLSATSACVLIYQYTSKSITSFKALSKKINEKSGIDLLEDNYDVFPSKVVKYGAIAHGASVALSSAVWAGLLIFSLSMSS